jgi:hypothetical protein
MDSEESYLDTTRTTRTGSYTTLALASAMLGAGLGHGLGLVPGRKKAEQLEEVPCRQCGKPTTHKKRFCSGDCHRKYNAR